MAATNLHRTIVFEDGDDDWTIASVPEVPGTHSQGRTRDEARANVIDALETMLRPDGVQAACDSEALVLTVDR